MQWRRGLSSPRPWGCFCHLLSHTGFLTVFPTPVGVFPISACRALAIFCLPHARGGVSVDLVYYGGGCWSSPRPWGCFFVYAHGERRRLVFPTPVGVFPFHKTSRSFRFGLPHARGGVSGKDKWEFVNIRSSPRPWGCFWAEGRDPGGHTVFPTPVGVFLKMPSGCLTGVQSSPRPWGCFRFYRWQRKRRLVFPTPVGVFPRPYGTIEHIECLPHARGGVSAGGFKKSGQTRVFPTPVGVFLTVVSGFLSSVSLPHARGGVSLATATKRVQASSSPRPWGCFLKSEFGGVASAVFPTPVGVFLALQRPLT